MAPSVLATPVVVSANIRGTSSLSHSKGKKSISAAKLDDHMVVVGKANVGTIDCRRVSNSSLIDDLGDCNLPSHDLRILRDISNVPVINMGASN